MNISRRGHRSDHGVTVLTNEEGGMQSEWSPDGQRVYLSKLGRRRGSVHRYTVVIDSKELRTIMRESIDNTDLADSEKELWRQIFTLWEKTTRRGK